MLRPFCALLVLLAWSVLAAGRTAAQPGDPAAPPRGLKVVFVNVGQGDATIVIGPAGIALVNDGGPTGRGASVVAELRKHGVTKVRYVISSHYHADHVGGLDEVMRGITVEQVWDRGTRDQPSTSAYSEYVREAGSRRRTVSTGQVFDLGGGARARVLAYDGNVLGRSPVKIRGTRQQENSASVVLRVDYHDFSMWLGGDLTGGGNSTADVETPVSRVCGDVDVYHVNHHGSVTSTNASLLGNIRPEVCVASNGAPSPFGHPHTEIINAINTRGSSRLFLNTTAGSDKSGYTVGGTMTVVSDGWRYRFETSSGGAFDLYTDEYAGRAPEPGDLVISELHRRPSTSLGEYVEIQHRGASPVNLRGLTVAGNSGSFTIAAPYRLLPGGRLVLLPHGDPLRNGGLPAGHCTPFRALALGDTSDNLRLVAASRTIDSLSYGSGFAGGAGRAAERADIVGPSSAANFKTAVSRYASDWGTPGATNGVDTTTWPLMSGVEVLAQGDPGGRAVHLFHTGFSHPLKLDVAGLSRGTSPGIVVGQTTIPLNAGAVYFLSLQLPGFAGFFPQSGMRATRLPIPAGLTDTQLYTANFLLAFSGPLVPATSAPSRFLLP